MSDTLNNAQAIGDNSLKQYLIDEFVEDYQEGRLTRRDALKSIAAVTMSLTLANCILAACAPAQPSPTSPPAATVAPTTQPTSPPAPTSTPAATTAPTNAPSATDSSSLNVSADDPSIQAASVQFPSQAATIMAYLARPKGNDAAPAVLVCHENRGLTDHIRDVTRRLAKAGYVGLAVDLLSRQGGTDKVDAAQVPGVLGNTPPQQMVQDFQAGLDYLKTQSFVTKDRYGMVGFCFGGGVTWRCATQISELRAAVPYYGPNPPLEDVPKIQAAASAGNVTLGSSSGAGRVVRPDNFLYSVSA